MLGHGTEYGLIGHRRLIIDSRLVYLLRQKPESVFIWCNADEFVRRYQLKGFFTGMIISEYEEAMMFINISSIKIENIQDSNVLFSSTIKNAIDLMSKEMYNNVKENYISLQNNIIQFNSENIYHL